MSKLKFIILLTISALVASSSFGQWTQVIGKYNYKDSFQLSKYHNNVGLDSVFAPGVDGKVRLVKMTTTSLANEWHILGNTVVDSNFLGTLNNKDLKFRRNNIAAGFIGTGNTGLGLYTLNAITSGNFNMAMGGNALALNETGSYNMAIGYNSLANHTGGNQNTGVGSQTLGSDLTGIGNTAVGYAALFSNDAGTYNTAIGFNAMFNHVTGSHNVAVGDNSLIDNSGNGNVAIGQYAGRWNTSGSNQFFLNNYNTGSFTNDSSKSLAYGIFNSTYTSQRFKINGKFQVNDGTAGSGKVFTDASGTGIGTWTTPSWLNISDTAAMLTNYVRSATAPLSITSHNITLDTSTLSGGWHSAGYYDGRYLAAGSGVTTIGTFSASSITNGASISGHTLTLGVGNGTNPGMISTTTQTIAGVKTFSASTLLVGSGTALTTLGNSTNTTTITNNAGLTATMSGNLWEIGQWGSASTLRAGSAGAGNSNRTGIDLNLASGLSTGSGTGGNTYFQYSTTGSSGTSLNSYATAMTVLGTNGYIGIGTTTPTKLFEVGSLNPVIAMNQTTSGQKWHIRTGVGTGIASGVFNIYDSTNNKQIFTANSTRVIIGNPANPYSSSTLFVQSTTSTGSNIDAQADSTVYDESDIEAMKSDYSGGAGLGMRVWGNVGVAGTVMGVAKKNTGLLDFNNTFNAIRVLTSHSLWFGTNDTKAGVLDSLQRWRFGSSLPSTDKVEVDGNLSLMNAGNKIKIATGSNASVGISGAMTAGSITISTTAVTASSVIMLTPIGSGTGSISLGTVTAGTSFVINSSDGADTRAVQWWIIN